MIVSGSVALLADTIHNLSDALTAVPLWVRSCSCRRAATRRYTYGYGRVEDLAGLFIVDDDRIVGGVAGYESIRRLLEPQPLTKSGLGAGRGADRVRRQRARRRLPDPGRAAGSAPRRWSPTACMPAPTGSPRWPWYSA